MKTHEVKKWLQALLEGEVVPGSEAWERIWHAGEFEAVRKAFLALRDTRAEALAPEREKIWKRIEEALAEGNHRRPARRRWPRYAATLLLPLLGIAWWLASERPAAEETTMAVPVVSNNRAVLVTASGERLELSRLASDTAWQQAGVTISLDTAKVLSYTSDRPPGRAPEYNTLIVPRRGEYQLVLDDGTRVFLNSESELRYPIAFGKGETRRVYLKGEGYFEVTPDEKRPFVVTAGEVDIRVLGTRFDVSTHAGEGVVAATLVAGSVRVSTSDGTRHAMLKPNEQALVSGEEISVQTVDASAYISWVHGRFCFEGATLKVITGQLERWYDARFIFAEEALAKYLFTGMIKREYSLEEVIAVIARTTFVQFDREGDTITIHR
ncbi:MAG: DUF4974 domain-containing protein [Odoribacteraceae bacterium]|jgi:ferric-dicitrate binding protein FerR (iron transport regulator)|nr:DUF4974 domain-containing protein [Odoribacteraceae bacterium]